MTLRTFSYGGGVQSTAAALVLAAEGRIDYRTFLFADVGDQAENPATIAYVRDIAVPFATEHGLDLELIRWTDRTGLDRDLYNDARRLKRDIPIPMRLASGAYGNRTCTKRYKIEPIARHLRKAGATVDDPATIGLGISTDEIQRAHPGVVRQQPWTVRHYPLLDVGVSRTECARIIDGAGLPVPEKSSCWFCPFQSTESWRRRKRDTPDLFAKAVAFERELNQHRTDLGRDGVYLHGSATLDHLDDQGTLFDGDDCDTGYCFT